MNLCASLVDWRCTVVRRPFHVVAEIDVVVDDHLQPPAGRCPRGSKNSPISPLAEPAGIRHAERLDLEEAVEDRMRELEPVDARRRQHRRIAFSKTDHSFGK